MNAEGDRLSNLPDDLIHKILSFIDTKDAVKTSGLSSRWRYIWTSMPTLNLSDYYFLELPEFSKFVTHVLTCRNNQIEVPSAKLTFFRCVSKPIAKRILDRLFSYNIQQLNVTFTEVFFDLTEEYIDEEFPLYLFRSQSLENLTLSGCVYSHSVTTLPAWDLPTLVTLNLHCIALYDGNTDNDKCAGFFSNCVNLKNLTLKKCKLMGLNGFNICHPGLLSLSLEDGCKGVNVITPQLKNLTINNSRRIHVISSPSLSFLHYRAYDLYFHNNYEFYDDRRDGFDINVDPLQLSSDFHLEKADICINQPFAVKAYTRNILCLLQQLHSVKCLTLNLELVKLLFESVELISHQPSPFVNLKTLKIYQADPYKPEIIMPIEVKNYLLDGSLGATLTMVSYEKLRAVKNFTSSRNLMTELRELIDEWKVNSETNTIRLKPDTSSMNEQVEVENHTMKCYFGERMTHIESYWKDLSDQYEKGHKYTRRAISIVRKIDEVLKKLPASDRAKLQARFSGLCSEAVTIMDDIMEMQCSKPRH